MRQLFILASLILMLACVGCDSEGGGGPTDGSSNSTPFLFTKPSLGSTFTYQFTIDSAGRTTADTTFIYEVTNVNASHAGKTGLVEMMNGISIYPFYVSYAATGDLAIWGNPDIIYGRDEWIAYPYTLNAGGRRTIYFHDSVIELGSGSQARAIKADSFMVITKEPVQVKGVPVESIKSKLTSTYTLTDLTFGFTTSSSFSVYYWYAPSLGFWTKWEFTQGPYTWRYTMIDHSP